MSQKLSHVPRPSRCILRSCVVRPHSQWHWPPHVTHHHGHGTSGPSTAGTRIPCRPAGSARQRFAHIHMDSASLVLCRPAAAPVLASLCCRTRACPGPAPILQSPIRRSSHAAARPAAVQRRGRSPVSGPVPSTVTPNLTMMLFGTSLKIYQGQQRPVSSKSTHSRGCVTDFFGARTGSGNVGTSTTHVAQYLSDSVASRNGIFVVLGMRFGYRR